ncbi:hypothetical protein R1flu_023918 [Riccia fluitans]|uniref:Uncharacterized protein n=1 Tax=Riccia fluitans TaxID=41844 RepID=A0ABD1XWB4_9MARC
MEIKTNSKNNDEHAPTSGDENQGAQTVSLNDGGQLVIGSNGRRSEPGRQRNDNEPVQSEGTRIELPTWTTNQACEETRHTTT